ncbi:MAG: F0F1 ATP synthase subunit A [Bacteroidales bacterium]|nr:F0F1 ATP synthase subunit A [Bacteroidales bacterium]
MKRLLLILVLLSVIPSDSLGVISSEGEAAVEKSTPLDISGVIFSHVGDAYEWHLMDTPWGSVALPLPVIVRSKTSGWHCFSSGKLEHGASYEGFRIGESGKVVETTPEGEVRPFDLSITKNVVSLILSSILLAVLILLSARWYRRHDVLHEAPKGIAALLEPLVMMVHTMALENIGEENYRKYSPYLCTAFFFILLNNFLGILPIFPGGANLTGNIAIAMVLALFTFFTVNLFGNKHYYKEIFWPEVPVFLKPIMPIIEVMSALVKPISLTIRLFANMLAGHIMILCMVCIIFIMAKFSPVLFGSMTAISVIFGLFLDLLECLVAFIQAYVFTMLSSIYIGLAHAKE